MYARFVSQMMIKKYFVSMPLSVKSNTITNVYFKTVTLSCDSS